MGQPALGARMQLTREVLGFQDRVVVGVLKKYGWAERVTMTKAVMLPSTPTIPTPSNRAENRT